MSGSETGLELASSDPQRARALVAGAERRTGTAALLRRALELRFGFLLGTASVLVAASQYRAYANRAVLGRWSPEYAGLLLVLVAGWLTLLVVSVRRRRASNRRLGAAALLDCAALTYGAAFWLTTLDQPPTAGRLATLSLFSSTVPAAVVLEWLAMLLLVLALAASAARGRDRRLGRVAMLAVPTILFMVVLEGGARLAGVIHPRTTGFPTYADELWYRRYVRLNAEGFRDEARRSAAEPNVRRLLLIGDSFVFGWGLDDPREGFGPQVEARLRAHRSEPWEVINAGVPDRHTLQEIEMLEQTLSYAPAIVLLLYVFNDIDYLAEVTPRRGPFEAPRSLRDRLSLGRLAYANSHLYQQLYVRLRGVASRQSVAAGRTADPYLDTAIVGRHVEDLRRFVRVAESAGARAAIIPFDPAVASNATARTRYTGFVTRARAAGLPVWDIDVALFAGYAGTLRVSALDGHPNARANAIAADAVLGRLLELVTERRRATPAHSGAGRD